jgi:hypothetical protein
MHTFATGTTSSSSARKPFSADHDTNGLFQTPEVLKWIPINQKEIGTLPLSNRAARTFAGVS